MAKRLLTGDNKQLTSGKKLKGWLVAACVFTLVFAIAVAGALVVNARTKVFTRVEMGDGYKNKKLVTADDRDMLVLGLYDNLVQAYDSDEKLVWEFAMAGATSAVSYDEELGYIIVGSYDRNIYVLNIDDGTLINKVTLKGAVDDMDYDANSHTIAVCHHVNAQKVFFTIINAQTCEVLNNNSLKTVTNTIRFTKDYSAVILGNTRAQLTVVDFDNNEIYSTRLKDEIKEIDVAHNTGDFVAITVGGYVYRYTPDETAVYVQAALNSSDGNDYVRLNGEGYSIAVTDDGQWISTGTRQGDVFLFDENGIQNYYERCDAQVTQIFIGEQSSYVVTLSDDLYRFDSGVLDGLKLYENIDGVSLYVCIALAVIALTAWIVTFGRSRELAARFFASIAAHKTAYLMLLPTFALVIVFNYYPVFQALYYAFTDWSSASLTMRDVKFIGFDNFVKMVENGYFLVGLKNMFIIMLFAFLKLLTVPVILALLVYSMKSSKSRYAYRLLLIAPMVVPGVVGALMWKNIYDPSIGAATALLKAIGAIDESTVISWLGDEKYALWSIIFMGFPWVHGMAFLVFYGGLLDIPTDLFEAAKVDGSNAWWDLWHIKIPLITPQLKMMVILTFISSIQDYGGVFLLTGGGPGHATYVPGLELYYNATKFGQYGYACALGLVMFAFIMVGTVLNLKMKTQELN